MHRLPADFMAIYIYIYFLDLLFFVVNFFYFEVFDNFHVFTLN